MDLFRKCGKKKKTTITKPRIRTNCFNRYNRQYFLQNFSLNSIVYTVRHKKLHHFVFAITLYHIFLYLNTYWYTYTAINLEQTDIKIINLI